MMNIEYAYTPILLDIGNSLPDNGHHRSRLIIDHLLKDIAQTPPLMQPQDSKHHTKHVFPALPTDAGCLHSIRIDRLCAICGAEVPRDDTLVPALHFTDRLFQTSKEALRLQKLKNKKLYEEKKMTLILDLDQTIIHTTLWKIECDFTFLIDSAVFYVKLRPHLDKFLDEVVKLFEIHIYTMGTREYAEGVCKLIDPDGKYFGDRVVSRSENFNELKKSISRISCISRNVVILDDRADVWDYNKNLVLIRPFWYRDRLDINDPSRPPLYLKSSDPRTDEDDKPTLEETVAAMTALTAEETMMATADGIPETNKNEKNDSSNNFSNNSDKELLRTLKVLKSLHKRHFKTKKPVKRLLRLSPMKRMRIACRPEHVDIVLFSGATVDLHQPMFVIGDEEIAKECKVKNVRIEWIYECIYRRGAAPIDLYVLSDYSVADEYEKELEAEFF